jgi:D-3-phosphoglycerate dehydrogenase
MKIMKKRPLSDQLASSDKVEGGSILPLSECRVLVTPTSYGENDSKLKTDLEACIGQVIYNPTGRPMKAAELIPLVKDIDGYIAGLDEINKEVIQAARQLRVIARYGVGVDRVDLKAATQRRILVTNTPGANSAAVAELTLTFILALARNLCVVCEKTKRGEWPRGEVLGLGGKTIGLIGFGAIGQEVALRLKGFGCRLLAYDPYVEFSQGKHLGINLVPLDSLLSQADFVSLHTALTPETKGLVSRDFLERMKPGAFLINTARGELVDEPALVEAIQSGHIRGAALDCFRQEPPERNSPLLTLPQVIVTAHVGAHTDEAINRMGWMALESCLTVLRGEKPAHAVNPEVSDHSPVRI